MKNVLLYCITIMVQMFMLGAEWAKKEWGYAALSLAVILGTIWSLSVEYKKLTNPKH